MLGPIDGADVSDDLLAFHTDPFFAECRAYGRIEGYSTTTPGPLRKRRQPRKQKPKQIRAKIAARCYGFLALKTADENGYLAAQGIDLWSDIDPDDDYRLQAEGSPIRGLVKEYIAPAPAAGVSATLTVRHYNRMLRSIKILNNTMRIIHRRVQAEAFHPHSGLLVSFGTAWTMEPHCIMDVTAEHIAEVWREADLVMFDDMVEEAGFGNRVRALPDLEYVEKLRSSGRMH